MYVLTHTKKPREKQSKNKGIFQKHMDTKDTRVDALVYEALYTHTPKLQVIFRKRATIYRALLRKMTSEYKEGIPCLYATLYDVLHTHTPQLQVIFRKRATIYRALLREMTSEDKASHVSTPPSTMCTQNNKIFSYF